MIKKFRIAAEVDTIKMENIVNEMRDLLEKLVSGEIPNEDTYTRSDLYLAFFPTYIVISILTRVLSDYPEIPEQIPNYADVLRKGFKFVEDC